MPFRLAIVCAVVAGALAASSPSAADERRPCEDSSWVGGMTEWCDGTLVHRDHIYDDYGADLGAFQSPHGTGLNRGEGDVDHREHGQTLNSADLRVLRLRLDGRRLHARFELNTLFPNDRSFAALAVDVDADRRTGGGAWRIGNLRSDGWDQLLIFRRRDVAANVIEGSGVLRRAPGPRMRLAAAVALGDGTPMNVAFRGRESGDWWEARQAAALADGDITAFAHTVDVVDFARKAHRPAGRARAGYYDRVFRSDYPIGEGVSFEGVAGETTATFHYLGSYQPYAVYVPRTATPHGVQLVLHGASAAHASVVKQTGMQATFGDALDRILVSPLSRGPSNSYVDWGARDAVDALADVHAHYRTDRERVFVSGYSMGGGGTLFLSTLFPDLFAGAVAWVPFTGDCLNGTPFAQGRQRPADSGGLSGNSAAERDGCPLGTRGNSLDYMDNLRHVPNAHLFAAADELVWANHALAVMQRTQELGYEHVVWTHLAEHLTFAILDDWTKEAEWTKDRRRVRRPARVTYRTNSFLWMPKVDLMPDGAYWIDGLRPRNSSATPTGDMVVDLTSHACRSSEHTTTTEYGAGGDPVPWLSQEGVPSGAVEIRRGLRISGSITNVREVTIDTRAACFAPGTRPTLDIAVDGPTTVWFTDGGPPAVLRPSENPRSPHARFPCAEPRLARAPDAARAIEDHRR